MINKGKCPYCCTEIESTAKVCAGCGAEVVIGPRYAETILGGLICFIIVNLAVFLIHENADSVNFWLPTLYNRAGVESLIENNKLWIRTGSFCFGFFLTFLIMRKKKRFARKNKN